MLCYMVGFHVYPDGVAIKRFSARGWISMLPCLSLLPLRLESHLIFFFSASPSANIQTSCLPAAISIVRPAGEYIAAQHAPDIDCYGEQEESHQGLLISLLFRFAHVRQESNTQFRKRPPATSTRCGIEWQSRLGLGRCA